MFSSRPPSNLPEDERHRLAKVYAAMTDEELEALDERSHSLTTPARLALEEELDRRELQPEPGRPLSVDPQPAFEELTVIRKFRDLPEALLAKGLLESSGIECFLADDNLVRMDWFISNFIGGIKLQVRPNEVEAAIEVLDQPIPETFDFEGAADYQQPRCPKCQSLDIAFEELDKPVAYASAWLGMPLPVQSRTWKCGSCGRRWEDDLAE